MAYREDVTVTIKLENTYNFMGNIDTDSVRKLIDWFTHRSVQKNEGEILQLVINSCGGWVDTAFAVVDLVLASEVGLHTLAIGEASSMAIPIFLAGSHRLVAPRARFVLHELGRTFNKEARYSTTELRSILERLDDSQQIYSKFIVERTKFFSVEEVLEMMRKETMLNASQVVQLGFADEILKPGYFVF